MDVVMFNGYAGPGWVWPIGRKSFNVVYCGYTKVLRLQKRVYAAPSEKVALPPMGADFKAAAFGRGFFTK